MKNLIILIVLGLHFSMSAHAAQKKPLYTAACQAWSEKWQQMTANLGLSGKKLDELATHLDPKSALALFQDYPGEVEKPYLKGNDTNLEKIRMRYEHPGCTFMDFFDLGKVLNQTALHPHQTTAFRHALFESIRHDAKAEGSRISFAIEHALVKTAVEKGKIHLNEAEAFELAHLDGLWQRLQDTSRYENTHLCSSLNFCLPWTAEKTVKFYEHVDDEMRHIRAEYGVWMDHVEGNKNLAI